jgi:pyruvate dehydrogenase E1 component alpha subunit
MPVGTGLAFAMKYNNEDAYAVSMYGDGAANQGQVYETFNMASLWKLPVIFVIENNQYAMGTSTPRSTAGTALYERGSAYGIVGKQVDGMDVLAVREAGIEAIEYARSGKGPYILEMKTYRYRGHSMSDPAKYRTREEVDAMRKQHDPIDHLRDLLLREGIEEAELKLQDTEVKKIISEATDVALASPEPSPDELYTDILVEFVE